MCSCLCLCVYDHVCVIGCVQPVYLRSDELIEVWCNVEADPIYGPWQSDPSEEQDEQHEVGIGG